MRRPSMDPDTLLTTTRSVRRKLDLERPVDTQTLSDCLASRSRPRSRALYWQGSAGW